jgi:metal-sulfur cluster biosynthetic enzyme
MKTFPSKKIIKALRTVNDPELGVPIVDLGLIYGLLYDTDDHTLFVEMTLTTPACPLQDTIRYEIETALADIDEIDEVDISFVHDPEWSMDMVSEETKRKMYGLEE